MDEKKKAELLAEVRKASKASREVQRKAMKMMSDAACKRAIAVREALDAGIPRQEIADAAGAHRNHLYRLLDHIN